MGNRGAPLAPGHRSLRVALLTVGGTMLAIAAGEVTAFASDASPLWWLYVLSPATGWVWSLAGVVAWWRRPSNQIGVIMLAGGAVWLLTGLGSTTVPLLAVPGVVLATVPLAILVHLVHAFPSGRLRSGLSRVTVLVGYGVCLVLQAPLYLFIPAASPGGMLAVADRPDLAMIGRWLQSGTGLAVMVVTALVLNLRLRTAPPGRRRMLIPLYGYGVVAVLIVPMAAIVGPSLGLPPVATIIVQVGVLALAPVAFGCAVLLGGFARTGEMHELRAWLADDGSGVALTQAVGRMLGDDSLELAFWVPGRGDYLDRAGLPLGDPGPGRALWPIQCDGRHVGAFLYHPELTDDEGLLNAAGRVVAVAIDRQRLEAELLSSQRLLQQSRVRIMQAADRERRRISQNLHDGLQAELVLLAVQAQRLDAYPAAAQGATALRRRIDEVAAGVRELVHALMPPSLIERGLGAAIEDLADRMPIPTRVHLGVDGFLPNKVQSSAYFIVAEALTNATKHAHAGEISVRLTHDGGLLRVQVSDNGIGGAAVDAGFGLHGVADRVDALGGRLQLISPPGLGTLLVAELPCGV